MAATLRAPALVPGIATGIGSLPHLDPHAAAVAAFVGTPDLPAAPQLPGRDPREGMVAQWVGALPEVGIAPDGSLVVDGRSDAEAECVLDPHAHGGLLAFLELAEQRVPTRIKLQVTGPLTLGMGLRAAGMSRKRAFRRGALASRAWAAELERVVTERLPDTSMVLFFDEPALVAWSGVDEPIDRESAIDLLSGAFASVECATGVHVCGEGELGVALEAGPTIVGVEVGDHLTKRAVGLSRFLDADGWVAWGAVPTDRPVGESADPHWRRLGATWCELTRRGCDPVRLRTRAVVTPACGLAGYGASQAERVLGIARELATRVHDQAIAARLTLGA